MTFAIRRREFAAWAGALSLAGCAAPVGSRADRFRVGFGSCTDQTKPQPIWDTILRDAPDVFLFGGDNVYANAPFSPEALQAAYATEAAVAGFARLRDSVPHMEIWDDGDYGLNDGGVEFAHKQLAKDEFLKFWRAPANDSRRQHEGLYDARIFGTPGRRVQVIILDTRWFRSPLKVTDQRNAPGKERYVPDPDPAKTMLGPAQWAWLEQQLRQPAELRLVLSGVQVVVEGHGWERWGNLPLERQRLYDVVRRTRANGVVFLSGDRHIGAIYRETKDAPYPMHEITASGFTHTWQGNREAGPNRLGDPFTELHFGSVDVDWNQGGVELSIKNIRGEKERVHAMPLNQLEIRA
jgi:alkaline phosphatase D